MSTAYLSGQPVPAAPRDNTEVWYPTPTNVRFPDRDIDDTLRAAACEGARADRWRLFMPEAKRYGPIALGRHGASPQRQETDAVRRSGNRAYDTAARRVRPLDDILGLGLSVVGVDITDPGEWADPIDLAGSLDASTAVVPTDATLARSDIPVLLDLDGRLDAEFSPYRGRFLLLRPDHFVAAAQFPDETDRVRETVSGWRGRRR